MKRLGKWCLCLLATSLVFQGLGLFEQGLMSLALGGFVASEQEGFMLMSSLLMGSAIGLALFFGSLKLPKGREWGRVLVWMLVGEGVILGAFALGWWFLLRGNLVLPGNQLAVQAMVQAYPLPLMVLKLVFFAPIMEEVLCRGLFPGLFEGIEPLGHLASVLFFAWLHGPESPLAWLIYGGMGAVFSLVAWRGRNLLASILCHALHNSLVLWVMLYWPWS